MAASLLVVEHDLGFGFWLAKLLDCAGFDTFPARSVHDAFVLLREISGLESSVRMIIIDDKQADAERLIGYCRQRFPGLHVMWLRDRAAPPPGAAQEPTWIKPAGQTTEEGTDMLIAVGRVLASG